VPIIQGATIFALTHQALGEWRRWREVLDASDVEDGFELEGREYSSALPMFTAVARLDESGEEELVLSDVLDVELELALVAGDLVGDGALRVEDGGFGSYTLEFRAPGESQWGPATSLEDGDFAPRATLELVSASGGARIALVIDRDVWLVMWLARELSVRLAPGSAREALLAPVEVAQ